MTAAAYAHADGGKASEEIILGRLIDRFGVEAIMGRPYLGYGEINRIYEAETILNLYRESKEYRGEDGKLNWAKWAQDNKDDAEKLASALMAAKEEGYLEDG